MANEFSSPNQMSNFNLKVSYWYIVHKLLLKKILIGLLIALNVGLFGFVFYRLGFALFVDGPALKLAMNELTTPLIDYPALRQKNAPAKIVIEGIEVVPAADNLFDYAVKLTNPNQQQIARRVTVQLVSNGEVAAEKTTFVYPASSNYVMFFNQSADPNSSEVRLGDVGWERFLNFTAFADPRLRFEITNKEFIPAGGSNLGNKFSASILRFDIKNASAYSYWQVGVHLLLLGGQGIGGINYLALDQFRSGETRTVEMRWLTPLPTITDSEILPEVDILNSGSYMSVK